MLQNAAIAVFFILAYTIIIDTAVLPVLVHSSWLSMAEAQSYPSQARD